MALNDDERTQLGEMAKSEGLDPDEVVSAAEEQDGGQESGGKPAPASEVKVYQYHLPFLRVSEIRAFIGLTAPVPDGDLLCGEWLAMHGGSLAGGSKPGPESPPQ